MNTMTVVVAAARRSRRAFGGVCDMQLRKRWDYIVLVFCLSLVAIVIIVIIIVEC